jgi:RNase P subunit RPR2
MLATWKKSRKNKDGIMRSNLDRSQEILAKKKKMRLSAPIKRRYCLTCLAKLKRQNGYFANEIM